MKVPKRFQDKLTQAQEGGMILPCIMSIIDEIERERIASEADVKKQKLLTKQAKKNIIQMKARIAKLEEAIRMVKYNEEIDHEYLREVLGE